MLSKNGIHKPKTPERGQNKETKIEKWKTGIFVAILLVIFIGLWVYLRSQ